MGRLAVAAAIAAWAVPIAALVGSVVPDPYMDEIFHVPQVQRYCSGDFLAWDPMITTPPGLYYLSLAYVASLFPGAWLTGAVPSFNALCSNAVLRSTNVVMAMVCGILVHDLLLSIRPGIGERKATVYAILVALYPLHWFFTFLYYTDVASLAIVLAMYLACLKKRFWVSAMFGAFSILFRQTNVIWMIFIAANGAIRYVQDIYVKDCLSHENHEITNTSNELMSDKNKDSIDPCLRRRRRNTSKTSNSQLASKSSELSPSLVKEILDFSIKLWSSKYEVLIAFSPFAMVIAAFVAFIIWNGGIVLGAKEAHVVSPHFAQFLYFGLLSAAALIPWHFTPAQIANLLRRCRKNKIYCLFLALTCLALSFLAVHFFSISHPYLLADNRHYTFYIWRKIIQAHWVMKYILIPLYIYSWFSIIDNLGKLQRRIWVSSFVLSVALVLVPAPLIEFRYYTIPFVLLILHSPVIGNSKLLLLGSLYAAVDLFTLAMFLFRPFNWEHERGMQRFMW